MLKIVAFGQPFDSSHNTGSRLRIRWIAVDRGAEKRRKARKALTGETGSTQHQPTSTSAIVQNRTIFISTLTLSYCRMRQYSTCCTVSTADDMDVDVDALKMYMSCDSSSHDQFE
jgi:flagellar capping protein FliD